MAKHRKLAHWFKYVVKRFLRASRKKKGVIGLGILINLLLIGQLYANFFVFPNTTLAGMSVSGQQKYQVDQTISKLLETPYHINIKNRSYEYSFKDLGVLIDIDQTIQELFWPNARFPLSVLLLINSFKYSRQVQPTLVFTQAFNQFIEQSIFDFSEGSADEVVFDPDDKTLVYVENEEKYRIDEATFKAQLIERIGNPNIPIYPRLVKVQSQNSQAVVGTSEKLQRIFAEPLTVYVDAGGNIKTFHLSEKELVELTVVHLSADGIGADISINDDKAIRTINAKIRSLFLTKENVVTPKIIDDLLQTLNARFVGLPVEALSMTLDKGPNTTGNQAKKYIEVDISQQKMYTFKDGKLVKSYRVSTGSEYPTPTGQFAILNKAGLGYSHIYDSWLPWWMGFSYSKELNAYFGIHEVPYKLTDGGQKLQSREFINKPNTGGCVALDVGAAQEVYRFADIGTQVFIFQ